MSVVDIGTTGAMCEKQKEAQLWKRTLRMHERDRRREEGRPILQPTEATIEGKP